jgi:hypothetical protein
VFKDKKLDSNKHNGLFPPGTLVKVAIYDEYWTRGRLMDINIVFLIKPFVPGADVSFLGANTLVYDRLLLKSEIFLVLEELVIGKVRWVSVLWKDMVYWANSRSLMRHEIPYVFSRSHNEVI